MCLAAAVAFAVLPGTLALWAMLAAFAAALALAGTARRLLGGYTGDVLGAASVLAECAVLSVLAARP